MHPTLDSVIWTIVGILAIVALVVYILPHVH